MLVVPDLLAGLGVQRVDVIERRGGVHDAVDHDGRGLHGFHHFGLENPRGPKLLNVGNVDLAIGVIARLLVIAVGVQEVIAVAGGKVEHVLGDGEHVAVHGSGGRLLRVGLGRQRDKSSAQRRTGGG